MLSVKENKCLLDFHGIIRLLLLWFYIMDTSIQIPHYFRCNVAELIGRATVQQLDANIVQTIPVSKR